MAVERQAVGVASHEDKLYSGREDARGHNLFIATHSPYILTAFLERNYDLNLFLINEQPSGVIIDTASDEDIQRIYDHGIDAFDLFERRTL